MHRGIASSLNPDAGWHDVSVDAHELDAAARASARSWSEVPYYEARFGERGKRFSLSDSAWLMTLCETAPAQAIEQICWLGALLSSRGMPQILLERHLEIVAEELGRAKRYGILRRAARELRRLRHSIIAEKTFQEFQREFEERVAAIAPFSGFGIVLVSAIADEKLGIEHAVSAVADWATDTTRFPRVWADAVKATIEAIRER